MKIISLGAGVQSSAMFLMSCYGELEKADAAIFADTQDEPKSVYKYLEWLEQEGEKYGIPIYRVTDGSLAEHSINTHPLIPLFAGNTGGTIGRSCTKNFKLAPLKRKARQLMKEAGEKSVEMWIGISTDEIQRMKDSGVKYITNRWPLIEKKMDRNDCKVWVNKVGAPPAAKSACVYCPFRRNSDWARMKKEQPDEFARAVEFDKRFRKHKKLDGDFYVHSSLKPLDEIDFTHDADQIEFGFLGECEGMCGL